MRIHGIPLLTLPLLLASCTRVSPETVRIAKDQGAEASPRAASSVTHTATPTPEAHANDTPSVALDGASPLDATLGPSADATTTDTATSAGPVVHACASDGDCVLVTGGCQGPMAAHRDDAARTDAQNRRLLSIATCDGRFAARPVRPVCTQSRCVLEPMDHPEWRVCERTRECMPVHRNCQHWQSINRRFEREARDAMHLSRPCGPVVVPPPPPIECRYGWCVAGWAGQ